PVLRAPQGRSGRGHASRDLPVRRRSRAARAQRPDAANAGLLRCAEHRARTRDLRPNGGRQRQPGDTRGVDGGGVKQSDTGSAIAGHVARATSGGRVPVKVAIVGCGNIAGPYASPLTAYQETELIGVADIDPARAAALSAKHGCRAYADYTELLADDDVEIVVNLSVHTAHYDLTRAALMAGKHVYSEKPLALTSEQAHDLVALAEARGRRLACSPFTFLGDAQRTAWSEV